MIVNFITDTTSSLQDGDNDLGNKDSDDENDDDDEEFRVLETDVTHPTVAPR